jgi:putative endonuclease
LSDYRALLGKAGEDLACQELERRGYVISARRWRGRAGEIDIVARDGTTLVFVEVKTRSGSAFGAAAEAVSARKRLRIARLAKAYMTRHRLEHCSCRFDVVAIDLDGEGPAVRVFQNAFDARTA